MSDVMKNITANEKHILDVTCGMRGIWFQKKEPHTLYCDRRQETHETVSGTLKSHRTIEVKPDMICDFTDLPFADESFELVVFDPPHIIQEKGEGWMTKMYGCYRSKEEALDSVSRGIHECLRVLKPYGVLIFKWAETSVATPEIIKAIGVKPLFGHRSGKKSQTNWMAFMKFEKE